MTSKLLGENVFKRPKRCRVRQILQSREFVVCLNQLSCSSQNQSESSLSSQFPVTNLKDNSSLWQSVCIEAFIRANIFFNCMQSVYVEKQLCSTHCDFNNSQPIYSLRGLHMHRCFYCFLFVNCLCSKDNDQDRFHV